MPSVLIISVQRAAAPAAVALLLVTAWAVGAALAQDKPAVARMGVAMPDTAISEPVLSDSSQSARIFLDRIEVLGAIAKPQALFIVPGNDPEVEGLQIDRSFFVDIFRPVEWSRLRQRAQHHRIQAW